MDYEQADAAYSEAKAGPRPGLGGEIDDLAASVARLGECAEGLQHRLVLVLLPDDPAPQADGPVTELRSITSAPRSTFTRELAEQRHKLDALLERLDRLAQRIDL